MLSKDALEIVLDQGPSFYSRLFLVEKVTGGWRPVIDLSHLNEFVRQTPFKREPVVSVHLSVREGDFLVSIDLKDAYFQIPVHQSSRKLLSFLSEGTVSVQGPVFRTVDCPTGLHQGVCRCICVGALLASSGVEAKKNVQDLLTVCHSLGIVINEKSDLVPSQTAHYLGMTIGTVAARIFPSLARVEKFVGGGDVLYHVCSPRSALAGGFGSPGVAGEASSSQSSSNALSAVAFEDALVRRVGSSLLSGAPVPGGEGGFVLVDGEVPSSQGGLIRDTCSRFTPVLGRVSVEVGRTPPRLCSVRGVVGAGEVAAHQSSGNEGNVSGIAVFSGVGRRSPCDRDVRQLDGSGLRQQAGRDGLPFPLLGGQPASEVDGESRRPPRCQVSSRAVQCSGRSPQPPGSGYRDRVVSPPSGSERPASSLGLVVDRPVHDELQREASSVLFPCPGSPGGLRGCVLSSLGQPGAVRISTLSSGRKGGGSSQRDPNLSMTLIAPLWPEKDWFADLLLLLTQPLVVLLWWDQLLWQPHFNRFHNSVHALNLHTWRLSRVSADSRAFREDLLLRCPAASVHPLPGCTRRSGCSSVVGVMEGALLQSTPLYP